MQVTVKKPERPEGIVTVTMTESEAKAVFQFIGGTCEDDRRRICATRYNDAVIRCLFNTVSEGLGDLEG